ncbi:MAG TPA: hypothetical protein VHW24_24925 [Bryobacteraceae bacterium]|jgi:hypothetical protein|nr:hypothetical protein [Bryobacteraceae bacterium]
MDTRFKIVDASAIRGRKAKIVTGYFDPLLAWHAEKLEALRGGAEVFAAAVLPLRDELVGQRARAELVAALRVIDYVLIASGADFEAFGDVAAALDAAQVVRLDEEDLRRRAELIADVRSRPTR